MLHRQVQRKSLCAEGSDSMTNHTYQPDNLCQTSGVVVRVIKIIKK